ncbi:hypothetical protein VTK26DRAFT_4661 [Humicola hyalothermophila]
MNRSIEQALLSLLPTHNSALPQALTDLASSLLTQSRHRASTLKAEEEVARPYACAHLACDRLKITLDLPPIEPRPPVPPRIYKRLYSHLDKILPAPASTPSRGTPGGTGLGSGRRIRTPSAKIREQQLFDTSPLANKSSRVPRSRTSAAEPAAAATTPNKEKSLAQLRDPTTPSAANTPSKKRTVASTTSAPRPKPNGPNSDPLPRWIRATLRFLTSTLGPSRIGPVVAAGLESIITPRGRLTDDAWVLENLVTVLGAVYLYVWRGVSFAGKELNRGQYVAFRGEIAHALKRARQEVDLGARDEEEDAWEGWREAKVGEFDTAMMRMLRHGWFDLDWVDGMADLAEMEKVEAGADGVDGEKEMREEEDGRSHEPVRFHRPDTMFQERFDYLTDTKRKAYADWKEGIMKRVKRKLEEGISH